MVLHYPLLIGIEFDYTPTAITNKTGWENIFRITDGKKRSVFFKDRLVAVFKEKLNKNTNYYRNGCKNT